MSVMSICFDETFNPYYYKSTFACQYSHLLLQMDSMKIINTSIGINSIELFIDLWFELNWIYVASMHFH